MKAENVHYIDNDTRVCLKFSFNDLEKVLELQRKRKNKWKTVSRVHPINVGRQSPHFIVDYLLWEEEKRANYKLMKSCGKRLMSEIKATL